MRPAYREPWRVDVSDEYQAEALERLADHSWPTILVHCLPKFIRNMPLSIRHPTLLYARFSEAQRELANLPACQRLRLVQLSYLSQSTKYRDDNHLALVTAPMSSTGRLHSCAVATCSHASPFPPLRLLPDSIES